MSLRFVRSARPLWKRAADGRVPSSLFASLAGGLEPGSALWRRTFPPETGDRASSCEERPPVLCRRRGSRETPGWQAALAGRPQVGAPFRVGGLGRHPRYSGSLSVAVRQDVSVPGPPWLPCSSLEHFLQPPRTALQRDCPRPGGFSYFGGWPSPLGLALPKQSLVQTHWRRSCLALRFRFSRPRALHPPLPLPHLPSSSCVAAPLPSCSPPLRHHESSAAVLAFSARFAWLLRPGWFAGRLAGFPSPALHPTSAVALFSSELQLVLSPLLRPLIPEPALDGPTPSQTRFLHSWTCPEADRASFSGSLHQAPTFSRQSNRQR